MKQQVYQTNAEYIEAMMKKFKLVDMREQYRDLILEAEASSMDYESFLIRLLSVEEEGKRGRRTDRLRKEACFEAAKRLEDIDYGFEGRYAASLIEDERYFLEVSRYIHLNPVKAMMVREPLRYKYSSYSLYVSGETEVRRGIVRSMMAEIVDTGRVLGAFPREPREQYRMFVEGKISHEEQEMLIMKDMKENELWLPW